MQHLVFHSKLSEAVNGGSKQPDRRKVLKKEIKGLLKEIKANDLQIERLVNFITDGKRNYDAITSRLDKLESQKRNLRKDLQRTKAELKSLPSPEDIKEKQKEIWYFVDSMSTKQKITPKRKYTSKGKPVPIPDFTDEINRMRFEQKILDLDFENKRKLLEKFFQGKTLTIKNMASMLPDLMMEL